MKDFAGHLPDAANILKPKNDQENLPTSLGSGIAFVNYSDSSDVRSGNLINYSFYILDINVIK